MQITEEVVKNDLYLRLKHFALSIIRLYVDLPKATQFLVIGKQVLRSGTSVGAQYAESRRSRSKAEFESKLQSALQELEETKYWIELLIESDQSLKEKLFSLLLESDQLIAILVSAINTSKSRS